MTTLTLETEPTLAVSAKQRAHQVSMTEENLIVALVDGRSLSIPLAWYPRLQHATPQEQQNWELLGDGYAIEWADLDEHIGVEGLLAGRRSGESQKSFERWLASRHQ